MRTVFVHGINQQGRSAAEIRAEWLAALNMAVPDVETVFYGDALVAAMEAGGATAMGLPTQDNERDFVIAALHQIALDYHLDPADIADEQAIAQGILEDRRIIAILRALEKASPMLGELALRVVRQAYAYLKRPIVAAAVDALVKPVLAAGPCIVVAHSLGTVVSYRLMRSLEQQVPLFVTLGSPLGLLSVQSALGRPRVKPSGVKRWWNGLDPNDIVTLGKALNAETFADGIVNKATIDNGEEPHSIIRYLTDPDVRREVAAAVVGG